MAIRDWFRRRAPQQASEAQPHIDVFVAADRGGDEPSLTAFDNSNITYSSKLGSVSYDDILRDKQRNIETLYRLADYYTDADPIVHGIVKNVYVPFTASDWYLTCDNEKTIDIYEEHYRKIRLREAIDDIFLQYYKYGNVFVYIWNGCVLTLPPHKCKIGNMMLNGVPVVDFDVLDISTEFRQRTYSYLKDKNVKDDTLEDILKAYPPEVAKALREGKQYATLDPNNCYPLQMMKEGWTRYAIPWIASALPALAKKELISNYETALLNIGARPFLHVKYGDTIKGQDILPDRQQLTMVRNVFSKAMSGNPLAVTNHLASASVIQADMKALYQWPLYENVNEDILAAGGIAGIIVNGQSQDGSTFASAQVSTQSATARIEAARKEFEEFMNKVNRRLAEDIKLVHTNNMKSIPEFHFKPFDINGLKAFRETCQSLWEHGVVSTETLLNNNGFSLAKEKASREKEKEDGTDEVMQSRDLIIQAGPQEQHEDSAMGRPKMKDDERNSDPENAIRSKQSKDAADGDIEE